MGIRVTQNDLVGWASLTGIVMTLVSNVLIGESVGLLLAIAELLFLRLKR